MSSKIKEEPTTRMSFDKDELDVLLVAVNFTLIKLKTLTQADNHDLVEDLEELRMQLDERRVKLVMRG